MSSKSLIWICMVIGSVVGGYIPTFFGASFLSLWSILGNTIGGIGGVIIAYKLTK